MPKGKGYPDKRKKNAIFEGPKANSGLPKARHFGSGSGRIVKTGGKLPRKLKKKIKKAIKKQK